MMQPFFDTVPVSLEEATIATLRVVICLLIAGSTKAD